MKLLSWYASFGEELRGLRGTVLGWQKYCVCCSVCFVYRMQSKLKGFFLFLRHSSKRSDKWLTTSEVAPFFSIWSHLRFFMMNWKDYNLSKYTIIDKCKCMLYQINKFGWLFFLILHSELWDLKLAVIAVALITRQKWNGNWKKVIFRPNMCLYFRFWNCHPHRERVLNGLVPNPPRV